MSAEAKREVGEYLAEQLPRLDPAATYICGCDPRSVAVIEGAPWVHSFEWGWHSPTVPHPDAEYWPANGDGAVG